MKLPVRVLICVQLLAFLFFSGPLSRAMTLDQLRDTPALTPDKLASYFAGFEFKFHEEVQDHEIFWETKSGDCDDYATLAAEILAHHGYTPRLIAVRMKGETHVVCYIPETGSYLDYNCRNDTQKLVPCSSRLTDIAHKVADSFGRDWVATYEFTYREAEKLKRLVDRIVTNRSLASVRKTS